VSWRCCFASAGHPVLLYNVTALGGGGEGYSVAVSGAPPACYVLVPGLPNGVPVAFTVVAVNDVGSSNASVATPEVVPSASGAPTASPPAVAVLPLCTMADIAYLPDASPPTPAAAPPAASAALDVTTIILIASGCVVGVCVMVGAWYMYTTPKVVPEGAPDVASKAHGPVVGVTRHGSQRPHHHRHGGVIDTAAGPGGDDGGGGEGDEVRVFRVGDDEEDDSWVKPGEPVRVRGSSFRRGGGGGTGARVGSKHARAAAVVPTNAPTPVAAAGRTGGGGGFAQARPSPHAAKVEVRADADGTGQQVYTIAAAGRGVAAGTGVGGGSRRAIVAGTGTGQQVYIIGAAGGDGASAVAGAGRGGGSQRVLVAAPARVEPVRVAAPAAASRAVGAAKADSPRQAERDAGGQRRGGGGGEVEEVQEADRNDEEARRGHRGHSERSVHARGGGKRKHGRHVHGKHAHAGARDRAESDSDEEYA
jgi:hypothetical protein